MVHKTENVTGTLLAKSRNEDSEMFERITASYSDLSMKFTFKKRKDFSKQFAHVYAARLAELRDVLTEKAKAKWGNIQIIKLAELEDIDGQDCIIIGTLYKHQQCKPSILQELSEDHQLAPSAPRSDYCSDKDQPFLEDEMLRVKLVGSNIDIKNIITGIICAVLGHEREDGTFDVKDWCYPGCAPKTSEFNSKVKGKLLLLSGLDLVNNAQSLAINLLTEWITGMSGMPIAQREEASIIRVVIAGNSVRSHAELHTNKGHSGGKAQDNTAAKETAIAIQQLDSFLNKILECCSVTLMPGQHDPTNVMLPQQPLHPCIIPKSSRFENLSGVTNPWIGKIGTSIVIGSSGQPIEDIMRVSGATDISPLEWLEKTLSWRHLCPTAPDTLPSYPYYEKDLFIMKECPDIYFVGNTDKYETKLWKGDKNQEIRLICIPRFSSSHTAVLVDLESLDTQAISFGTS